MAAKNLSNTVKPVLDANNVRFIGVGFDSRFVQPFVEGGFFKGGKLSQTTIRQSQPCTNSPNFNQLLF